jgi:hypothetical protein
MGDTTKKRKRATVEAVPDRDAREDDEKATSGPAEHEPATCPVAWCPVCLAVTAVQPVRPEVVEHLLKAGTEFFLALRSLVDARADEVAKRSDGGNGADAPDTGLHKIDIG